MRHFFRILFLISLTTTALARVDVHRLNGAGYIMGPGDSQYPTHKSWNTYLKLMEHVTGLDDYVDRMVAVLCSDQSNRSILFVGEPNNTFRYIWARMAVKKLPENCPNPYWQVEIDQSKIVSGNSYVGMVEAYWKNNVLGPVDGEDAVLYFANLPHLIGLGSHSNNEDGIETELANNLEQGRMRAVGFANQYDFNRLRASRHAYVLNAFAETILLKPVIKEVANEMARKYLEIFGHNLDMDQRTFNYLARVSDYYQPNISEPQRTMRLVTQIVRSNPPEMGVSSEEAVGLSVPRPYYKGDGLEAEVHRPDAVRVGLDFDFFDISTLDTLEVRDGHTGLVLKRFSGKKDLGTVWFSTNHIKIQFNVPEKDEDEEEPEQRGQGFAIGSIMMERVLRKQIGFEDVRDAIFKVVQIPRWVLERDYEHIKRMKELIDADVVGVEAGKRDLMRLVKNGYVAGRTDDKPIASALFVGPTGTGKSYIAKKLAEFLELKLVTIDMTSFRSQESMDRFLDIVGEHLVINPYAVFMFEEIDKADPAVLDRLYFMLDEGIFYGKGQRPLFARGAFVIMTTNAGHDIIIKEHDAPDLEEKVDFALQKTFRPSFLNRFDARTIFMPFTDAEYHQLARIMTTKKIALIDEFFGWELSVDDATVFFMGTHGRSKIYGARPMERLVENTISIGIAEYQMTHGVIGVGDQVSITKVDGEENVFQITVNEAQALTYEVDMNINTGSKESPFYRDMMQIFANASL